MLLILGRPLADAKTFLRPLLGSLVQLARVHVPRRPALRGALSVGRWRRLRDAHAQFRTNEQRTVLFEFNFSAVETEDNGRKMYFGEGGMVGPTTSLTKASCKTPTATGIIPLSPGVARLLSPESTWPSSVLETKKLATHTIDIQVKLPGQFQIGERRRRSRIKHWHRQVHTIRLAPANRRRNFGLVFIY